MPTTKQRINITVDKDTGWALKKLAKMYKVPVATKATDIIRDAIELQEDLIWAEIAESRAAHQGPWIDHETFWKGKV